MKALYFPMFFFVLSILAEPIQYCNFSADQEQPSDNDFCIAARASQNPLTNHHDLYISFEVYRTVNHSRGWTAVGIGASMAQSLSFIAYGDSAAPILSVRRLNGHWEPLPFDSTVNKGKIEVLPLQFAWISRSIYGGSSLTASMAFVCRSCDTGLDPDLEPLLSMASASQPWIWAKNTEQQFSTFSNTSSLKMHLLKKGWGAFYMDMTKAVGPSSDGTAAPAIKGGVSAVAAYTRDRSLIPSKSSQMPISHSIRVSLHGYFMALAFLLVFPCGIIAVLNSRSKAFRSHWMLQLTATICVFIGIILGFYSDTGLNTIHQKLGFITVLMVGVQAAVGIRHHTKFLGERFPTWPSSIHVSLGWAVMVSGYCSILTGLQLHGAPLLAAIVIGIVMAANLCILVWAKLQERNQLSEEESSMGLDAYWLITDEE